MSKNSETILSEEYKDLVTLENETNAEMLNYMKERNISSYVPLSFPIQ